MSAASKIDTVVQIYGGRRTPPLPFITWIAFKCQNKSSPVLLQNLNHQERQGQPRPLGMLGEWGAGELGAGGGGWVSEGRPAWGARGHVPHRVVSHTHS